MSEYSETEIQTAKKLHDAGYKWLARDKGGEVYAHSEKPHKTGRFTWIPNGIIALVSGEITPIFQGIKWTDNEPTYIEDIIRPQILDDAERRYLSAVIGPFKNRVRYIAKVYADVGNRADYYIFINFTDRCRDMNFPVFHGKDMYKGMKLYHPYSLEELGLQAVCEGCSAKMEEGENEA